jgi:hypothetical protein
MLMVGLYTEGDTYLTPPTTRGAEFLRRLDEKSFESAGDHSRVVFVDEFIFVLNA